MKISRDVYLTQKRGCGTTNGFRGCCGGEVPLFWQIEELFVAVFKQSKEIKSYSHEKVCTAIGAAAKPTINELLQKENPTRWDFHILHLLTTILPGDEIP